MTKWVRAGSEVSLTGTVDEANASKPRALSPVNRLRQYGNTMQTAVSLLS